ncbi:MAG TPA: response regulator [Methylomirabilota bacterium]|jgi:CheY-like chemotaxis protein
MVSATRDRVDGTLARIRRCEDSLDRSVGVLRRSRYRLHRICGGGDIPKLPDLSQLAIVIVEGDTDNRDVFATFLRACGAHVVAARSADVALRYLAAASADVIMSDVSVLPSGEQFIDHVRSMPRHRRTPLLAVTGWTEKDVSPAECGFTAFMQKPVDLDQLGTEILRLARVGAGAAGLASPGGA